MLIRPPVAAHNIVALWHRTTSCDITCIYSYPQGAREADSLMLCPGTWFGLLSCPTVVSSVHSVASLAPRPVWNCQTSLGMRLTVGRNCQKLCYIPNTTSSKYTQVYQRFNIPDVSWVCHLDSTLQDIAQVSHGHWNWICCESLKQNAYKHWRFFHCVFYCITAFKVLCLWTSVKGMFTCAL